MSEVPTVLALTHGALIVRVCTELARMYVQ